MTEQDRKTFIEAFTKLLDDPTIRITSVRPPRDVTDYVHDMYKRHEPGKTQYTLIVSGPRTTTEAALIAVMNAATE